MPIHFSLWLNEGFANYMQNIGSYHAQDNNTDILDMVVLRSVQGALERGQSWDLIFTILVVFIEILDTFNCLNSIIFVLDSVWFIAKLDTINSTAENFNS